jgi:hypothetical protein
MQDYFKTILAGKFTNVSLIDYANLIYINREDKYTLLQENYFIDKYNFGNKYPTRVYYNEHMSNSDQYVFFIKLIIDKAVLEKDTLHIVCCKSIDDFLSYMSESTIEKQCNIQFPNIEETQDIRKLLPQNIIFLESRQPINELENTSLKSGGCDDFIFWLLACALYNIGYTENNIDDIFYMQQQNLHGLELITKDKQKYYDIKNKGYKNLFTEMKNSEPLTCVYITTVKEIFSDNIQFVTHVNTHMSNVINTIVNTHIKSHTSPTETLFLNDRHKKLNISSYMYNYDIPQKGRIKYVIDQKDDNNDFLNGHKTANICSDGRVYGELDNFGKRKGSEYTINEWKNLCKYLSERSICSNFFFESLITYIKYIQNKFYPTCVSSAYPPINTINKTDKNVCAKRDQ